MAQQVSEARLQGAHLPCAALLLRIGVRSLLLGCLQLTGEALYAVPLRARLAAALNECTAEILLPSSLGVLVHAVCGCCSLRGSQLCSERRPCPVEA